MWIKWVIVSKTVCYCFCHGDGCPLNGLMLLCYVCCVCNKRVYMHARLHVYECKRLPVTLSEKSEDNLVCQSLTPTLFQPGLFVLLYMPWGCWPTSFGGFPSPISAQAHRDYRCVLRHQLHAHSENSHVGALHMHGKCFNHGDISSALGTSVLSKEVQGAPSTPSTCKIVAEWPSMSRQQVLAGN